MPVLTSAPVSIISPAQPFDRLAFRCALSVTLAGGTPTPDSTLSLHATRYRKPAPGAIEACGLVGHGEWGRVAQVLRTHQEGLLDRVGRYGPLYQYPARRLLGLSPEDLLRIEQIALQRLAGTVP